MQAAPSQAKEFKLSEAFSPRNIRNNTQYLIYVRSSLAAFAGIAAGILGLQGLSGFLFYLVCSVVTTALIILTKAGWDHKIYFTSRTQVWLEEVSGSLFSYLLFWTLAYGLVHLYD
ncbi:Rab5-interacting protein-domain-containing protein [Polychytrium aggregatum]|uniref:Rab5-interacting protein-domain-containing protein n=1 Tax=Polychytrium aggregatum TaxID=110093 RepID=UPI0022FDC901|nr:Rab5-interacting protein-domain-containing protein [Polychytrium aggregatum]KAI9203887.1 Rab5-interacting protein-domain-containing protein [Polychytrium aggregatum]